MRCLKYLMAVMLSLFLISCEIKNESTKPNNEETINEDNGEEQMELKINDILVDVTWYDNESVKELKKLAKDTLIINMHMYGGFEQVGSIGYTLPSNDVRITTNPGDIVLYSSSQLVVFYGNNTWAYTKLGHINLDNNELKSLLGNENVTITINLK